MIDIIILAIALSMDAFAVAIGLGAKHPSKTRTLAFLAALYFGLFQGVMPLIGYLGGKSLAVWVDDYAAIIAFVILVFIGAKMLYESYCSEQEQDFSAITQKMLLLLAIATSIDAMAAGFSLTLLEINPFLACIIIGVVTAIFSWIGVIVGARSGSWLKDKAAILGGTVLILIGFKLLLF
ncbi:manganese efflux pump MntP family protein [Paraglaciecola aquimarina]|uniref:Putative manganese efflux pump MntP n=1 Tax=Paraglaciecola aquimarina TaxID=1235557 RepID=A0ABU3SZ20_9ALTE|nr:manganese efflux pump MntP family protein [Paraglaciecola aquimarina]MDU0355236.1 manganese efflux pump MntP family protein [Paraglaciecola aquimarina]